MPEERRNRRSTSTGTSGLVGQIRENPTTPSTVDTVTGETDNIEVAAPINAPNPIPELPVEESDSKQLVPDLFGVS